MKKYNNFYILPAENARMIIVKRMINLRTSLIILTRES